MKFDTRKDKPLKSDDSFDESSFVFVHENIYIPENHTSDTLGRKIYNDVTIFLTPVLLSQRHTKAKRSIVVEDLSSLAKDLGRLGIDGNSKNENKKTQEKEDEENKVPSSKKCADSINKTSKKKLSPQTERLLQDTPEAFDPSLGRYSCEKPVVVGGTLQLREVTRSLRNLRKFEEEQEVVISKKNTSQTAEESSNTKGKKKLSSQTERLLKETPEAFDLSFGRCDLDKPNPDTLEMRRIRRSLRNLKAKSDLSPTV